MSSLSPAAGLGSAAARARDPHPLECLDLGPDRRGGERGVSLDWKCGCGEWVGIETGWHLVVVGMGSLESGDFEWKRLLDVGTEVDSEHGLKEVAAGGSTWRFRFLKSSADLSVAWASSLERAPTLKLRNLDQ